MFAWALVLLLPLHTRWAVIASRTAPSVAPSNAGSFAVHSKPATVYAYGRRLQQQGCNASLTISPGDSYTLTAAAGEQLGDACKASAGVQHTPPLQCTSTSSARAYTWTFRSASQQFIQVSTCGLTKQDTVLTVQAGCPGGTSSNVQMEPVCNDDACGQQSRVDFMAVEGGVYTIYAQVISSSSACWSQPSVMLSSTEMPAYCTQPVALAPGDNKILQAAEGEELGSYCQASAGISYTAPCEKPDGMAYAWAMNATETQIVTVDTCNTTSPVTLLSVRGGCDPSNMTMAPVCRAANCPSGGGSTIRFLALAGEVYTVYVQLLFPQQCWSQPRIAVSSSRSGLDYCSKPTAITPGASKSLTTAPGVAVGTYCNTTTGVPHTPACHVNSWGLMAYAWSINITEPQAVAVTTCGLTTDYSTIVTVRQGCDPGSTSMTPICDSGACGGRSSHLAFLANKGLYTIYLQLTGLSQCWSGATVKVSSKGFTCASTATVSPGDAPLTLKSSNATQLGDTCTQYSGITHTPPCAATYSRLAYTWTIKSAAQQRIQVTTCGATSAYKTILTVRSGCDPARATRTPVCSTTTEGTVNGSPCASGSTVTFDASAGEILTVYLQLADTSSCWATPSVIVSGSAPPSPPAPSPLPLSPAPEPAPVPSPAPLPSATQTTTINFIMLIPVASSLATDAALTQQLLSDLQQAVAGLFGLGASHVNVTVIPAAARRRLHQQTPIAVAVAVHAAWASEDNQTPAQLQQHVQSLSADASSVLTPAMVDKYGITSAGVSFQAPPTADPPLAAAASPSPAASPPSPLLQETSSGSSLSTGAIIGIVCAGIVAAAVLLAGSLWVARRRYRRNNAHKEAPSTKQSVPVLPKHLRPGGGYLDADIAQGYSWTNAASLSDTLEPVEAGINDIKLDSLLAQQRQQQTASAEADCTWPTATTASTCPFVQLSKAEMHDQLQLLSDGLLGRGASAMVYKCVWPSRFGPNAVLAAKVMKSCDEYDIAVLQSFQYEAQLLSNINNAHVVKAYGACLEPPNVCIILEMLPTSLKDILYRFPVGSASTALTSSTIKVHGTYGSRSQVPTGSGKTGTEDFSSSSAQPGEGASFSAVGTFGTGTGSPHAYVSTTMGDATSTTVRLTTAPTAATRNKPNLLQVLRISTDIAEGLAHLHSQHVPGLHSCVSGSSVTSPTGAVHTPGGLRIVHRDLKPANILINSQGTAKISDFGLAREHQSTTISTVNLGAGTLPYMAPELLVAAYTGGLGQAATNRVDVYSLGVIMWEMLAGEAPWRGMSADAIFAAVSNRRRPALPGIDASESGHHEGLPSTPSTLSVDMQQQQLPAHEQAVLQQLHHLIMECWQHRELRRPTAATVHSQLAGLLEQLGDAEAA